MVTIESYLRAYNCPSSNVKQFQLWRKWSMYKARLDMKSHKNILHQTHMLFQRPREWCCYLSILLFRPHIPSGCCDCCGINHTICLMKDLVWISKFQDLYIMRRADMLWSFLWAEVNHLPKWSHHSTLTRDLNIYKMMYIAKFINESWLHSNIYHHLNAYKEKQKKKNRAGGPGGGG